MFEVIKKRCSIRKHMEKQVEKEKLDKVLEAARLAPSAVNKQPWRFIVVTDPKRKESLRAACNNDWFVKAPVIILACVVPEEA